MNSVYSLSRRHYRILIVIAVSVLVLWFIWSFGRILTAFVLGLFIAWMLQPAIVRIETRLPFLGRHQHARHVTVVVLLYLIVAIAISGLIVYAVAVLGRSLLAMIEEAPDLIPAGIAAIQQRLQSFIDILPPFAREQVAAFVSRIQASGGEAVADFIAGGIGRIRGSSDMILGFASLPIFLFFLLKDWDKLRKSFYGALPRWASIHVENVSRIVRDVTGRYVRAQLLLAVIGGFAVYIMLTLGGIQFAVPLAVLAAIAELVPIIGPWLLSIVAILVILATDPGMVIWMALGYIVIRIVSNNVLEPLVQGHHMRLHPALVIVVTILGASIAGLLGFVIALPVTMTVVEVVKYARRQIRDASSGDLHADEYY